MCGLQGIHAPPPEMAVVPPSRAAFSRTVTRPPASAATSAAVSPAAPLPTTTRSATGWLALVSAGRHGEVRYALGIEAQARHHRAPDAPPHVCSDVLLAVVPVAPYHVWR